MTGVEQGSSATPKSEPSKAAQPSTASPAVVGSTNATKPAAATIPTPVPTNSTTSNP
jgi:hypothetical protein